MVDIEEIIRTYSFAIAGFATALYIGIIAIALMLKTKSETVKRLLFGTMVALAVLPTLFFAGSTIYLNVISESKGPVHWHADIEVWACGNEVELLDPTGLSNKIGTATLHEHNDKRIHLEGVVIKSHDASLGKFFDVIGGSIEKDKIVVPVNSGLMPLTSGITCGDGQDRKVQVFVYKTQGEYYTQQKLEDPASYIISPYGSVPPGDCIIVELDSEKTKTDRLCQSYKAALQTGKLKGER